MPSLKHDIVEVKKKNLVCNLVWCAIHFLRTSFLGEQSWWCWNDQGHVMKASALKYFREIYSQPCYTLSPWRFNDLKTIDLLAWFGIPDKRYVCISNKSSHVMLMHKNWVINMTDWALEPKTRSSRTRCEHSPSVSLDVRGKPGLKEVFDPPHACQNTDRHGRNFIQSVFLCFLTC